MKVTQKEFPGSAEKAARAARVFFFCGPDEAGAHDAATRIVSLLSDPGERVELSGADLKRDPVRLGDEARSVSLFGDTRHIWVRAQGDEAHDAIETLLGGTGEACPVLVVATGATDKSRTAKLLAPRPDALVAMFYPPDLRSVAQSVRTMADAAGVAMDGALAERIARACGLDTRLARSEVAKLALYLDASPEAPRRADAAALDAIGAKTEDDGFAPVVQAVLGGQVERVPGELRRIREMGLNAVGVVLALERRTAQLAGLAARLGPRGDVSAFVEAESQARRIFFKEKDEIAVQLVRWRGPRLERLVDRLVALHRDLMTRNHEQDLLLAQGLAEIARAAAGARRAR